MKIIININDEIIKKYCEEKNKNFEYVCECVSEYYNLLEEDMFFKDELYNEIMKYEE
jgi:hypothetical protein